MTPSQIRALVGRVLVPSLPGRTPHTPRYRVLGFGSNDVRVINTRTQIRSSLALDVLEHALDHGHLIQE